MIKTRGHRILVLAAFAILLASCQSVVVRVDTIPSNTPKNQPLYITGNFNNWDPGDERFQMQLNPDSSYTITLPAGFGTVEYKFTRGDWTTVEKDICGYEIDNHRLTLGEQDTVSNQIESWNDLDPVNCPRLTIIIDSLPKDTPPEETIAIAGNFNAWNPDQNAILKKDSSSGKYALTIDRVPGIKELEFKVTRGNLETSESDEFGNIIPNRKVQFGVKDTVRLSVGGWVDKPTEKKSNRVIFIIKELPRSTPVGDDFYLVSNLNDWTPGDRNFIFQKDRNGRYFFPFPRKKKILEYKITRGSWSTVEVDKYGFEIPNRVVNLQEKDTVMISIGGWKDRNYPSDRELTIVLGDLPSSTPLDADFYLAGDISGWNAGRNKFRFEKDSHGSYFLNIPRGGHMLTFKITRGEWSNVEVDADGSDIENRLLFYKDTDTAVIRVQNWKDRPPLEIDYVTLVIDELPSITPSNAEIFLAPDFNGWDPEDRKLIFNKLPDGRPYITVTGRNKGFEYKITRGGWETVEVDENGNTIPNRSITYGFSDTVFIKVQKWRDFGGRY
ncbi:MAG: hypothetical protein KQI35_08585 [Bacteroidetes bacterium]|nr:hypothetical protein [Bacteroidota bacterium]